MPLRVSASLSSVVPSVLCDCLFFKRMLFVYVFFRLVFLLAVLFHLSVSVARNTKPLSILDHYITPNAGLHRFVTKCFTSKLSFEHNAPVTIFRQMNWSQIIPLYFLIIKCTYSVAAVFLLHCWDANSFPRVYWRAYYKQYWCFVLYLIALI